jgi:tetratricopeptide (TPR) repeat protein
VSRTAKLDIRVILSSARSFSVTFLALAFCSVTALAHGPGEERIEKISALLAKQGDQGFLYAERGHIYMDNQHWQEAMDDFNKAALLDPGYVEYDLDRARLAYSTGNYLRALDFINLFLLRHDNATEDNATEALLIQARSYRELGQHRMAVISYEMALATVSIEGARASPEWYVEFAGTLLLTGEKDKALQILQRGIERLGTIGVFQIMAVDLEVSLGRYDAALNRIDQLLNQSQRKDVWLARRADILFQAGRHEEAEKSYQQAWAALQQLPQRLQNVPASKKLAAALQARISTL